MLLYIPDFTQVDFNSTTVVLDLHNYCQICLIFRCRKKGEVLKKTSLEGLVVEEWSERCRCRGIGAEGSESSTIEFTKDEVEALLTEKMKKGGLHDPKLSFSLLLSQFGD
jgi:hypothetical protein